VIDFKLFREGVRSNGYTAIDITGVIEEVIHSIRVKEGAVTVYSPEEHVVITLIEYEPNLLSDLESFIKGFSKHYQPVLEALLGKSVTVPIINGDLDLGTFKRVVLLDLSSKEGLKGVYLAVEGIHD